MTHDEKRAVPALSLRFQHSGCTGSSSFFSAASANPGKDQVQCPGFDGARSSNESESSDWSEHSRFVIPAALDIRHSSLLLVV